VGDAHNLSTYTSKDLSFGLFTDGQQRPVVDNTPGPLVYQNLPAWVVTYHDDCPPSQGLAAGSGGPCTTDWHVVVDAKTGEFLLAFNQ
jgi:hypothetical protein